MREMAAPLEPQGWGSIFRKSRTEVLGKSTEVQPRAEKNQFWVLEIKHLLQAALFTTVKALKQPKCPSTDDWIEKI